ncbi:hypothetical protein SARC_00639 [Sphaeroforma arctica JP610]|uniref:Uncharacterized protein n=1 Tax=Sphaeroforma arctica JP610 TaxID=667725 RepID=A0A0L0GG42_9EUKA|nr:hypothetical protein SARC_00639 [Sphaeroforma arctica JP610]KNC87253.1 hypothetical protein SARC_00639 [Sphaeroforma arctica JP610]|eukprot:XP_014161155.1 hypothetical protein SARC_00639 [Sphaeroforma arctica JP610]
MKYAFWAHVGCPQAWPRGIPLGGYPASIRLSVRPFTRPSDTETINPDRSSTQTSGSNSPVQTNTVGHTGVDAEADTERFDRLCALLQEELQHDIDRLVHRPVADS